MNSRSRLDGCPRRRRRWGWIVGVFAAAAIWGLTDVRDRGGPHPENRLKHRTDLTVYTEAGAAFFDGRPPYEVSNRRGWHYLYPPLFAMVLAPLHVLPTQDQTVVWFFLSVLLCWGCYRETRRILRELLARDSALAAVYDRWFPWLGVAVVTAGLFPTLNCLQRGQVGVLKLYLLLLGLRLILGGRSYRAWIGGGMVLALPVVLKIVPLLPVAFLLLLQGVAALRRSAVGESAVNEARRRLAGSALGVALGLILFFLLVPAALVGWKASLRHLDTWSQLVLPKSDTEGSQRLAGLEEHTVRNQSLGNAVYHLGSFLHYVFGDGPDDRLIQTTHPPAMAMDAPIVGTILFWLRVGLLAALVATGLRLGYGGDAFGRALGFALACMAMLVVSPIARGHYFMLLVPAALLLPPWLDRRGMSRTAVVMGIVPGLLSVLHYAVMAHAGRIGLLGLGTTCWLIAAMALVQIAGRKTAEATGSGALSIGRPVSPTREKAA